MSQQFRLRKILFILALSSGCCLTLNAQHVMTVDNVEAQPLIAQAKRVVDAMKFLGEPFTEEEMKRFSAAVEMPEDNLVEELQKLLDEKVVANVHINPESRVKVSAGTTNKVLTEQGWSVFLVKVHNEGGVTATLRVSSPNAEPVYRQSTGAPRAQSKIKSSEVNNRWLDARMFDSQPLNAALSGLTLEYRVVQIYSRDKGEREATFSFDVGQGTQDIGFRNDVAILFDSLPAVQVSLQVLDFDRSPTTAHFTFRDQRGRVYPARSHRMAPDFFFHDQVYRSDGESIALPAATYDVVYSRGPEYKVHRQQITIPDEETHDLSFRLERWIHMANQHWFSGDHHVHAAGCSHYETPTEGVTPQDMMRHIIGEDLNVGCVLSWGPCWYHQKEYFEGQNHELSSEDYLMRYDVEVSGFPSAHAGHLCLLNLKDDDFSYEQPIEFDYRYGAERGHFDGTETTEIGQWPSWDLPVLKWGKQQGGVVGFSHSGWGLETRSNELPNYEIPAFNGIGANEFIVDVCHDVCDFISTVDTPAIWELNIWYHTLNCGYTTRISGETDFPCIYGERVGLGRVYVKLDDGKLDYVNWVQGLKDGRSYVGDGLSHIYDFNINGFEVGTLGTKDRPSFLSNESGKSMRVNAQVAALLGDQPNQAIHDRPLSQKPYWHIERARIGDTNKVPVELIVNGQAVQQTEIAADGSVHDVSFELNLDKSSWVALRIFPSSHTNPIFVEVDESPIRASRRSAMWCLESVDACWKSKKSQIREHELKAAEAAFDFARDAYRKVLEESFDDR